MHNITGKRSGAFGALAKGGGRGLAIVALGALTVTALGAYAANRSARAARSTAPFVLNGHPAQESVRAGSSTHYKIQVKPGTFAGPIKLSVSGQPRQVQPRFTGTGSLRALILTAAYNTPTGPYTMVVLASGGRYTTSLHLGLTILAPRPVPFRISGKAKGLQPGMPRPLNLTLTNGSPVKVSLTGLRVNATSVSAPRSTRQLPCTLADFAMQQFTGAYPLVLPASSTRTLSSLGVPTAKQPQVMLIDRRRNQDGCQGANVTLTYGGQALAG